MNFYVDFFSFLFFLSFVSGMIRFFLFAIRFRNVFSRINNVLVECGGKERRRAVGVVGSSEFDTNEKNQKREGRKKKGNKPRPGHK